MKTGVVMPVPNPRRPDADDDLWFSVVYIFGQMRNR